MPSRRAAPPRKRIKLDDYLRRSNRRRWVFFIASAIAFTTFVLADRAGWLLSETGEWKRYEGRTFRVARVVDGDTLDLDIPSGQFTSTRVRLWGVDAPETAKPREGTAAEPFADDALHFARSLCDGKQVRIRLEPHEFRDRYDRLLAHVELPDGTVLNELLLIEGLARSTPRFPHSRSERYELLEKQAKFEKKGMWK